MDVRTAERKTHMENNNETKTLLGTATELFNADPEVKEALTEWFLYGSFNDLGDRLEYLRQRALLNASKKFSEEL